MHNTKFSIIQCYEMLHIVGHSNHSDLHTLLSNLMRLLYIK